MARTIVIEEFHLTVYARRGLRDAEYLEMRRTLDRPHLQKKLRHAVHGVFQRYPTLRQARLTLTR
jgi:hypothetical protein